jgi:putative heme iron utilization protein
MAEGFGGHQVPQGAKEQTAATLRATTGILGMPSDAERSRTLMAIGTGASLATMSTECPGFPFGSLVAYSVDEVGRPILCLSSLAEHSRNMAADPRASLMVTAPEDGMNDRLALSRVTLVGEMKVLEGAEREAALDLYEAGHPSAFYARFDDFSAYRLEVSAIRYVGGFGRMSWVTAEEYAAAEPDPLLGGSAKRIIEHMNDDHADALVAYCTVFARYDDVESARMVGVDRYGMDIMATIAGGQQRAARISFSAPVTGVDEVRSATVELLREARAQLSSS